MQISLFSKGAAGGPISRRVFPLPINHIGCTIRAYPAHAAELNNPNPESVHFFYKNGRSCAFPLKDGGVVPVPTRFGEVAHEIEVCLLLGETPLPSPLGPDAQYDPVAVKRSIAGIGLGLDWTIRGLQQPLAKEGLPWERSKGFERSAAFTEFLEMMGGPEAKSGSNLLFAPELDPAKFPRLKFQLLRNGELTQTGDTDDISFCPLRQVWEMHRVTRLRPGDVVMSGTTSGVGNVSLGDQLQLKCGDLGIDVTCTVVPEEEIEK